MQNQEYTNRSRDRRKSGKGRKNASKRMNAREMLNRVSWLSYPLIFWQGDIFKNNDSCNDGNDYLSFNKFIPKVFRGLEPGVYTFELTYSQKPRVFEWIHSGIKFCTTHPLIANKIHLSSKLVTHSLRAIAASKRYPKEFPKLVGNVAVWREKNEKLVKQRAALLRAVSVLGKEDPAGLVLEEQTLWSGREENRPSLKLSTETIASWLLSNKGSLDPGMRTGAVVLGQRRYGGKVSDELVSWVQLGKTLSNWPVDVVCYCFADNLKVKGVTEILKRIPHVNRKPVSRIVLEFCLWDKSDNTVPFLSVLSQALQIFDEASKEPHRRLGIFQKLMQETARNQSPYRIFRKQPGSPDFIAVTEESDFFEELNKNISTFFSKSGLQYETRPVSIRSVVELIVGEELKIDFHSIEKSHVGFREDLKSFVLNWIFKKLQEFIGNPPLESLWDYSCIYGRLCAFGDPAELGPGLFRWFETCRKMYVSGIDSKKLMSTWRLGLEMGISRTDLSKNEVARFVKVFDAFQHRLIQKTRNAEKRGYLDLTENYKFMELLEILGSNCDLPEDYLQHMAVHSLWDQVSTLRCRCPEARVPFLKWTRQCDSSWFSLRDHLKSTWTDVFTLKTENLTWKLAKWSEDVVAREFLSWEDMESVLEDIIDPVIYTNSVDRKNWEKFLDSHLWILDSLVKAAGDSVLEESIGDDEGWLKVSEAFSGRIHILSIVYNWHKKGYGSVESLVEQFLAKCAELDREAIAGNRERPGYFRNTEEIELLSVYMSQGNIERLFRLCQVLKTESAFAEDRLKGWEILIGYPAVLMFFSDCIDHPKLIKRFTKLFSQFSIAVRLQMQSYLKESLYQWHHPAVYELPELSVSLPDCLALQLKELLAYRMLNQKSLCFPNVIQKIIDRPHSLKVELETLQVHSINNENMSDKEYGIQKRIINLKKLLNDIEALNAGMERDLNAALVKQLQYEKLEALEAVALRAIRHFWNTVFGIIPIDLNNPDWTNALLLYQTTDKNKRQLKQLLEAEAKGNREYCSSLHANRTFISGIKTKGLDADLWLEPYEEKWIIDGEQLTLFKETNPLKVLQMGKPLWDLFKYW